MIVSIHQPHFLPWLGYFNKVFNSDVFVWLHGVQFRKNYFQNRTKIKNPSNDSEFWLTVPVKAKLTDNIDEVTIADAKWAARVSKTIQQFYSKSPYYNEYFEALIELINRPATLVEEVNYQTFIYLLKVLSYQGKVVRMDELGELSNEPNQRLIDICKKLGAQHYIAGKGGKNYLNKKKWEEEGINISWQSFDSDAITYQQMGKAFLPSLSLIDCLFNVGAEQTRELILHAWKVEA